MQPRPMAETESELPSVRFFKYGDPRSAAPRRSSVHRPRPDSACARCARRTAGALPALRVSPAVPSVPLGTWGPPAPLAANGMPSSELDPVAHPHHAARHLGLLLVDEHAHADWMLELGQRQEARQILRERDRTGRGLKIIRPRRRQRTVA